MNNDLPTPKEYDHAMQGCMTIGFTIIILFILLGTIGAIT